MKNRKEKVLQIRDLRVSFSRGEKEEPQHVVHGVDMDIDAGETVALVGESGSGKTVCALSILQLLPYPFAFHPGGSILFGDKETPGKSAKEISDGIPKEIAKEIVGARPSTLHGLRGRDISMIFQEPMTSLNPLHRVGRQIGETVAVHHRISRTGLRQRVEEMLDVVGLEEDKIEAYPHELSGGQRQRVMIAAALINRPKLLVADEPTTALDVTVQAQILDLLRDLQRRMNMAILLISHDLEMVRNMARKVYVMREGHIVEHGQTRRLFQNPTHPYTRRLLKAVPRPLARRAPVKGGKVIEACSLSVTYGGGGGFFSRRQRRVEAVRAIDLAIAPGRTLGVVGESGCGKTSLAMALLRLEKSQGVIRLDGRPIHSLSGRQLRPLRPQMQIVFQDPFASLNPRFSVLQIISEGLRAGGIGVKECDARTRKILEEVGMDASILNRFPHEFSGGQRQRIAIARALIMRPRFIVLDEPTSALDATVQIQIIELLQQLQKRYRIAYLFISHDLKVVRSLADDIAVMYHGRIVEHGPAHQVFTQPTHPYTCQLLAATLHGKEAK